MRVDDNHADRVVGFDGKRRGLHACLRHHQFHVDVNCNLETGIRIPDTLFEFGGRQHGLAGNHHVAHAVQLVDAVLQQLFHTGTRLHATFVH